MCHRRTPYGAKSVRAVARPRVTLCPRPALPLQRRLQSVVTQERALLNLKRLKEEAEAAAAAVGNAIGGDDGADDLRGKSGGGVGKGGGSGPGGSGGGGGRSAGDGAQM